MHTTGRLSLQEIPIQGGMWSSEKAICGAVTKGRELPQNLLREGKVLA